MKELGEALGIFEMSCLIVPDVNEIDLERATSTLSLYGEQPASFALGFKNDVLVEAGRRSGMKIVDAYGCFGRTNGSRFYYFLDNHLNGHGAHRVVECVRGDIAR